MGKAGEDEDGAHGGIVVDSWLRWVEVRDGEMVSRVVVITYNPGCGYTEGLGGV